MNPKNLIQETTEVKWSLPEGRVKKKEKVGRGAVMAEPCLQRLQSVHFHRHRPEVPPRCASHIQESSMMVVSGAKMSPPPESLSQLQLIALNWEVPRCNPADPYLL